MSRDLRVRRAPAGLLAAMALAVAGSAAAASLSLYDLDAMPLALACRDVCAAQPAIDRAACQSSCQYQVDSGWEKSGLAPIDQTDWMLAILEYWDDGSRTASCAADGGVVLPIAKCAQGLCSTAHPEPGACDDEDVDGLLGWEEALIGTDAGVKQTACASNAQCDFTTQCDFKFELGRGYCLKPRACKDGPGLGCTAFHLEQVASNMQEVILHVSYDYSPTPATVLDLRVLYSATDLVLLDARPLPLLSEANKGVSVTHPTAGVLRLVVLGAGSMDPIPNGSIVELVFQRVTNRSTTVRFDSADVYQRGAMAPSQGAAQASLAQEGLWGDPIELSGTGGRLLLAYSFDSLANPIEYRDGVPLADRLCLQMGIRGACPTTTLAALDLLQKGSLASKTLIDGVVGKAAYFDGTWDHLELPLLVNLPSEATAAVQPDDQSTALSVWILPEGRSPEELPGGHQIIWSHQSAGTQRMRYGIRADETAGDPSKVDLSWFDYGAADAQGNPKLVPFAAGLPLHKWVHLGMSLDAATGAAHLYVDGVFRQAVTVSGTPAISCPTFDDQDPTRIILRKQGEGSTRQGELIYLSTPQNGLFGVDRMDPTGFGGSPVVRPTDATVQDPDYSPLVDKVVYSSNQSGDAEIWIADGDGSNPVKLTTGFGNADIGVFARRPRWSPNAKKIVFESNVFDVKQPDNPGRVYQLYVINYPAGDPSAPLPSLDYQARLLNGTVKDVRLTINGARNHSGARWLSNDDIAYSWADPLYKSFQAEQRPVSSASSTESSVDDIPRTGDEYESSVRLLSASPRTTTSGTDDSRLLLVHEKTSFVAASSFSLSTQETSLDPTTGLTVTIVRVTHSPAADAGAESWPRDIPGLYLSYDVTAAGVDLAGSRAGSGLAGSPGVPDKTLELGDVGFTGSRDARFVKISVSGSTSPPLSRNAEIAVIRFVSLKKQKQDDPPPPPLNLELKLRVSSRALYLRDRARIEKGALELVLDSNLIEQVDQAAFSPDRKQLLLAGISRSRPKLLRASLVAPPESATGPGGAYSLADAQVIQTTSTRIEGLSWTALDLYAPCHRVAADRDATTGVYRQAFRGALDELKVYSYARDEGAFLSDAQRGHEWLKAAGRDGVLPPIRPTCRGLDTECPPYMICDSNTNSCMHQPCDVMDAGSCANDNHGVCTFRPLPIEDENPESDWLCSSECSTNSQCLQHDCLNGPCRFCANGACNECTVSQINYGSFTAVETVGCPDRNAWACENGNCVSQCYRIENSVSKYLCNPTEEYCLRGRCTPMKWDWSELGPSSLASLGEMKLSPLEYTVATPQHVSILIGAFGVEDYGHSPELLVEGRVEGSQEAFLSTWFSIGRVLVYNRTLDQAEDEGRMYRVVTQFPVTDLRLRLVTPPLENFGAAATGYGFPGEDIHKAAGSQFVLGYALNIPSWQVREACYGDPDTWGLCGDPVKKNTQSFRPYLRGGQPAVVLTKVTVNGMGVFPKASSTDGGAGALVTDLICSYEGSAEPAAMGQAAKKVFFGKVEEESSNEQLLYCQRNPGKCGGVTQDAVVPFVSPGVGLLNCNYFNPADQERSAGLTIRSIPKIQFTSPPFLSESPNDCRFIDQRDPNRSTQCYEIADGDGSFDVMNPKAMEKPTTYSILDFDIFRFFAWDSQGP